MIIWYLGNLRHELNSINILAKTRADTPGDLFSSSTAWVYIQIYRKIDIYLHKENKSAIAYRLLPPHQIREQVNALTVQQTGKMPSILDPFSSLCLLIGCSSFQSPCSRLLSCLKLSCDDLYISGLVYDSCIFVLLLGLNDTKKKAYYNYISKLCNIDIPCNILKQTGESVMVTIKVAWINLTNLYHSTATEPNKIWFCLLAYSRILQWNND